MREISIVDALGGKRSQGARLFASALVSFLNRQPVYHGEAELKAEIAVYAEAVVAGNVDALDNVEFRSPMTWTWRSRKEFERWRFDSGDIPPNRDQLLTGFAVFLAEDDLPPYLKRCPCGKWYEANNKRAAGCSAACRQRAKRKHDEGRKRGRKR